MTQHNRRPCPECGPQRGVTRCVAAQGLTAQPVGQCLAEMDADGGGAVEFHEFVGWQLSTAVVGGALDSMIRRYADADGNGEVTEAEYLTARRRTLLAISAGLGFDCGGAAAEGGQWELQPAAGQAEVDAGFTAVLEAADENQRAEFEQALAYFRYFDTDGDGSISAAEFAALHEDLVRTGQTETRQLQHCLAEMDEDGGGEVRPPARRRRRRRRRPELWSCGLLRRLRH